MPLAIGIVGLPNVGKSTLFNALTKNKVAASNYPFCTIDPNVGIVRVPDSRLREIAAVSCPERIVPTVIEFVDIAGLVKNAHQGEGLGNQFLSHIRECDAICEVVRQFTDKNVVHVSGRIDPDDDRETVNLELIYADLATVEKRLEKTNQEAKSHDRKVLALKTVLDNLRSVLNAGRPARAAGLTDAELAMVRDLNLLTLKPLLYVLNADNPGAAADVGRWPGQIIVLNAKLEAEIAELPEDEQPEYMAGLGLEKSGLDRLVQASYAALGLLTFFTTGRDETRAWTVPAGAKAPQAAGVIHTDFERGFIRAEVIGWQELVRAGSEQKARELGLTRTEGKDYVIKDGDICHFLINK